MSASGNISQSVRARLMNLRAAGGGDYNLLLSRYCAERLLYRLAQSGHREAFILKGATLFTLWRGAPHRATRDVDLLGRGDASVDRIAAVFRDVCAAQVEDDGVDFDAASVTAGEIRGLEEYGGVRVTLRASLGSARIPVQIDVGFGDAVTPAAEEADFPSMLGFPRPRLRVYPRETVVAEKLEAIARLGMANTRMKDYFDLAFLARHFEFRADPLIDAVRATFGRRRTPLTDSLPIGLTDAFADDATKAAQWRAFCRRAGAELPELELHAVTAEVGGFVHPVVTAAAAGNDWNGVWAPGGPWR